MLDIDGDGIQGTEASVILANADGTKLGLSLHCAYLVFVLVLRRAGGEKPAVFRSIVK
ncbi:hypothetical protein D9M71_846060 [compost metagenome]